MSTEVTTLFNLAEVASAAYANLPTGSVGLWVSNLVAEGMSSKEATEFALRYPDVVSTYHDPVSDLDLSVFKDANGNLTLGLRGTTSLHDKLVTDKQIGIYGAIWRGL